MLETDADLEEFIDQRGIQIVTLLHLVDDANGGAALLPKLHALLSPWALLVENSQRVDGLRVNGKGLTEKGRRLAQKLMQHGVWIDLTHASDSSARELIAMEESRGLPAHFTHTTLRRYLEADRGIADWELAAVARSGGVVGLLPSEGGCSPAPSLDATACRGAGCPLPCAGGIQALARQYTLLATRVPAEAIALGSDYSLATPFAPPEPDGGARPFLTLEGAPIGERLSSYRYGPHTPAPETSGAALAEIIDLETAVAPSCDPASVWPSR